MQRTTSTLWRFLLPVLLLLLLAPLLLVGQQTALHLENVRNTAEAQAQALSRMMQLTDALVSDQTMLPCNC